MSSSVSAITPRKKYRFGLLPMARRLVLARLNTLHTGKLVLIDGEHRYEFGDKTSSFCADMTLKDRQAYVDILTGGSIGAAESYMTGDWETSDLSALVRLMVRNMDVLEAMENGWARLSRPLLNWMHRLHQNSEKGARRNIAAHYDLGNAFFQLWLDPTMMYSSGIFPSEQASMEQASLNKLQIICEKLQLRADDHVLEIGTGWGAFALYAAEKYGCRVTTTTISEAQYAYAKTQIEAANLQDRITLLKQDYRHLEGCFHKIVSIEMIEAVGWEFYGTFFEKCRSLLADDGLLLLQAITIEDQRYEQARRRVDFIQRYIFPGSCIPSIQALGEAAKNHTDLRLCHLDDFAGHYARTLRAWRDAFNERIESVKAQGYSEEFIRMWRFYLAYCEGGFDERAIGVAHLLYAGPDYR